MNQIIVCNKSRAIIVSYRHSKVQLLCVFFLWSIGYIMKIATCWPRQLTTKFNCLICPQSGTAMLINKKQWWVSLLFLPLCQYMSLHGTSSQTTIKSSFINNCCLHKGASFINFIDCNKVLMALVKAGSTKGLRNSNCRKVT